MKNTVVLRNQHVEVEIALPGREYTGCRFDQGGFIKQITLDGKHTFLGKEQTKRGKGTKGLGMIHGWLWKNTDRYDQTPVGSYFPILGAGSLLKPDSQPYSFMRSYEFIGNQHEWDTAGQDSVTFCSYQALSDTSKVKIERTFTLCDHSVRISSTITNLGEEPILAEEYNHNFLSFDQHMITKEYKVFSNYPLKAQMVRGTIGLEAKAFTPLAFDEENDTIAFTPEGFGTEECCITTIENARTNTKAVLTEHFKVERAFVWISPWCLCPEYFKLVDLKKGEVDTFVRSIEVGYSSSL
jgi:hypothetical protein